MSMRKGQLQELLLLPAARPLRGCLGRGRAPSHPSVAAQAVSAACRAAVLTGHSELCVLIEV